MIPGETSDIGRPKYLDQKPPRETRGASFVSGSDETTGFRQPAPMGYSSKEKQAEYQRKWMAKRRSDWLAANGPCLRCGSSISLEVHHRNPAEKVDHKVWSWSEKRRSEELSKCDVLCERCHVEVTAEMVLPAHGTESRYHHKKLPCRCSLCREARRLEGRRNRSKGS